MEGGSVKQTSETCQWFDDSGVAVATGLTARGLCRFNPPSIKGFPIVQADDWCGDWDDGEEQEARMPWPLAILLEILLLLMLIVGSALFGSLLRAAVLE
jgi:hypothetical protein